MLSAYHSESLGNRQLVLGTRTSPMAMTQARAVRAMTAAIVPGTEVEIRGIKTSADDWPGALSELGGKGAFTREIDRALVHGEIDLAVHCLKDVPGDVPEPAELVWAAYLARGDVRDCLVFPASSGYTTLADLPMGARVGTSAARRKAQLLRLRPDIEVVPVRGNADTRIRCLDGGGTDALVVARAGLDRLDLPGRAAHVLGMKDMCPAVGAGVIAVRCRAGDQPVLELLLELDDDETRRQATAERGFLRGLHGHCGSPVAGHCAPTPDGRQLLLRGMVFAPDGSTVIDTWETGDPGKPADLGERAAGVLLGKGARDLMWGTPL